MHFEFLILWPVRAAGKSLLLTEQIFIFIDYNSLCGSWIKAKNPLWNFCAKAAFLNKIIFFAKVKVPGYNYIPANLCFGYISFKKAFDITNILLQFA